MEKLIPISEQEIPTFVDFIKSRIEATKATLASLEKTLMGLTQEFEGVRGMDKISSLESLPNSSLSTPIIHSDGYDSSWTWILKIEHLLRLHKELTTSNIVDMVVQYEPDRTKDKVMRSISSVVSSKSKNDGILSKRTNAKGEFVYSLTSDPRPKEASQDVNDI